MAEPPAPMQQAAPPKRRRSGVATFFLCALCLVLVLVFEIFGYLAGYVLNKFGVPVDATLVALLGAALGGCLGVLALGGLEWIVPKRKVFEEAIKEGGWLVGVSASLTVLSLVFSLVGGAPVVEGGWSLRFVSVALLSVGVGVSEEAMFRAILFGGILNTSGRSRKGLFVAAIVTSVLFGLAHIDWTTLDYASPLDWAQALLKVVQTGTLGFFFAALALRSQSIVGTAMLHGVSDFLLMFPAYVLLNTSSDISYVSSGEDGVTAIAFYAVVIALYLPLVLKGRRLLAEARVPDFGPFDKGSA